jgi:hypothetical protein
VLRIQKAKKLLLIFFTERRSNPHVSDYSSRDTGLKAFWSVVAPRAVLMKDVLAIILMLLLGLCDRQILLGLWHSGRIL